jgi:hypothetical protein
VRCVWVGGGGGGGGGGKFIQRRRRKEEEGLFTAKVANEEDSVRREHARCARVVFACV